jgi:fructokinase
VNWRAEPPSDWRRGRYYRAMANYPRLAGIELGGTKAVVVLGRGTEIVDKARISVTNAAETLAAVSAQLARWHAEAPIEALGIASFGPIIIDPHSPNYGRMLANPKPGWEGADVAGELSHPLGCPTMLHTDVTAAAFAEGRFGAARDCTDHVYMTIGTGIGIGIIAGGKPIIGQLHPEGGHVSVRRVPGDVFPGICRFHGDCFEGLASGPAIAARTGKRGDQLESGDPAWLPVVDAVAEACANLFLNLASQRVVIGGGVINQRPWIVEAVSIGTAKKLGGYLPFVSDRAPVVAAELGADAGPTGALLLAERALAE